MPYVVDMPSSTSSSRPPRKRFGQHFLTDRGALRQIAGALQLRPGEHVVEIGPGRGALTDELVDRAGPITAIEIDRDLCALLRLRYATQQHVRILEGDVLDMDFADIAGGNPYALVGNVPYYITTPIIFKALAAPRPRVAVFLVQLEVAERMAAPPGSKVYGALSVNVQLTSNVERVARVPAGAFHPKPKVDSAVVRITPRDDALLGADEAHTVSTFVTAMFGQRRRQLGRALRTVASLGADEAVLVAEQLGLDPHGRAEELPPETFLALSRSVVQIIKNRDAGRRVP